MYTYKSELLKVGVKMFSDKANDKDIEALDALINQRTAEGWEFVNYNYMATSQQIKGAFVVTFRKAK